jgi:VIT1/CCC1 family predicted Fe2+/Mn2+ transporter
MLLELSTAMVVSILWGLVVLTILNVGIAREQKTSSWKMVTEHLFIALLVIVITHYAGDWISSTFG